ncbi:hypothetical protein ACHAQJ_005096 [Trichoderma viride]
MRSCGQSFLGKEEELKFDDDNRCRLSAALNDSCKTCIEGLKETYEQGLDAKFLQTVEPFMQGLKTFSDGISTLTKHPTALTIVWGVIQLILVSAQHSYDILTHIAGFIESFAKHLPRHRNYAAMFPRYPQLHYTLTETFIAYMRMCTLTTGYLQRRPCVNFLRFFYAGGIDNRAFQEAVGRIKNCEEQFVREVAYAQENSMQRQVQPLCVIGPSLYHQTQESLGWPDAVMRPLDRNPNFYPRGDQLKQIEEHLCPTDAERGRRVAHRWSGPIFWLDAETSAKLKESFCNIARTLKLDTEPGQSGQELIGMAQHWLSTHNNWLLVYDNAVNFEVIKECHWPRLSQGSVLVATRNKRLVFPGAVSRDNLWLHLQPMTTADGAEFLGKCLERDPTNEGNLETEIPILERISIELGGLPLAIAHVSRCVRLPQRPPQVILEQLEKQPDMFDIWSFNHQESGSWRYGQPLDKAWDLPLSALSKKTRVLLDTMALIGIEMPGKMLSDEINGDSHTMLEDPSAHHLVVSDTNNPGFVSINQSLRKDLLFRFSKDGEAKQGAFEHALKRVGARIPDLPSRDGQQGDDVSYLSDLLHTVKESEPGIFRPSGFDDLVSKVGGRIHDDPKAMNVITSMRDIPPRARVRILDGEDEEERCGSK